MLKNSKSRIEPYRDESKRFIYESLVALFLFAVVFILYSDVINNFWIWEELQVLRHAYEHTPYEYFFQSHVWREISIANFTPMSTLSFDLDYSLFGFDPKWFYFHQLTALWILSFLIYLVLKLWVPRSYSLLGALMFLVSPPSAAMAEMLMLRHYLEGGVFAVASLYLFVSFLRKRKIINLIFSGCFFLMAILSKEVYLLLPLIFISLAEDKLLNRIKYTLPHILILIGYFLWRAYMLKGYIGGYNAELISKGFLSEVYRITVENVSNSLKMITGFTGRWESWGIAFILFLFLFNALIVLRKRKITVLCSFMVAALAMYAPVSPSYIRFSPGHFQSYRFVFALAIFYAILFTFVFYNLSSPGFKPSGKLFKKYRFLNHSHMYSLGAFLLFVVLILVNGFSWKSSYVAKIIEPLNKEGRFLYQNDKAVYLVKTYPFPGNNYYENLDFFKRLNRHESIPFVVSGVYAYVDDFNSAKLSGVQVYKYDYRSAHVIEITSEYLKERRKYLKRVDAIPFEGSLKVRNGEIAFQLGPPGRGRYFIMMGYRPGVYCFVIDVKDRLLMRLFTGLKTYIRFGLDSPGEGVTFSPEWYVDFSKEYNLAWKQG